jgi:hypothetical protein
MQAHIFYDNVMESDTSGENMIHDIKKYSTFNNGEEDLVAVPEKVYLDLRKSEDILQALQAYGVDNWDGYSQAMSEIEDEEE